MTQINSFVEFAGALGAGKELECDIGDMWADLHPHDMSYTDIVTAIEAGEVRIKPQLKKIDLSCLVGSGVLCEFASGEGGFGDPDFHPVGRLAAHFKTADDGLFFQKKDGEEYEFCRPLFNYWHHHDGGECPIPEGFEVEVKQRSGNKDPQWEHHASGADIIAYRITGIAEG